MYKIVVIGGSAGSLEAVMKLVADKPDSSTACYVIVVHRKNASDSILTSLLSSKTSASVKEVEDKDIIAGNYVYIAPPDYHLLLENEQEFALDRSEKIHYSRPSIDVTFESVADVFGSAAIGILLSGANADGAYGLKRIKDAGGFTIVQDPASADVPYMPQQALNQHAADHVMDIAEMVKTLKNLLVK